MPTRFYFTGRSLKRMQNSTEKQGLGGYFLNAGFERNIVLHKFLVNESFAFNRPEVLGTLRSEEGKRRQRKRRSEFALVSLYRDY